MTVKHMRIFLAVYQEMNITRAAELLHMTQPAVSRAVQELEGYYGIRLFERMNHKLCRTKIGEEFYARALHITESFDDLEKSIKDWDEFGILRVGASITLGNFFLPAVVKEFQERHPDLHIKAVINNTDHIRQGILDNTIDIAMIEGNASSEYIHSELLSKDCLKLILPPEHELLRQKKIYLKDLPSYPLLLREKGSAGRIFIDHIFSACGMEAVPIWESVSTKALLHGVSAGIGISILPGQLVGDDIASGKVVSRTLEDEAFIRNNYIIWHKQKFLTRFAKEFIQLCLRRKKDF